MPSVGVQQLTSSLSPVDAFDRIAAEPLPFFLDSALASPRLARWSFLGCRPFTVLRSTRRHVEVVRNGEARVSHGNPFGTLRELLRRYRVGACDAPVPFTAGAVGYLGYDLCHQVERLPQTAQADIGLPELWLGFYDAALAYDHAAKTWWACAADSGSAARAEARVCAKIDGLADLLERRNPGWAAPSRATSDGLRSNFTRSEYLSAVVRTKDYIAAGDIFQANISQRFHATLDAHPYQLYRRLRETNAAPFGAYLDLGGQAVASSSPERFLRVTRGPAGWHVETRPIKGTRPRCDGDEPFNARMRAELLASAKDNAELTMIVDLERNDLGRVCRYGSVRVTERAALEEYASVYHLVATVEGDLHERYGIVDLLKAMFPGGSITGAPKIRAMEIIDELEPTRRSVYTGSIGYIGFDGTADLNIAIRTIVIDGTSLYVQVGGGIVADSDPQLEYEETLHKGRAVFKALGCEL